MNDDDEIRIVYSAENLVIAEHMRSVLANAGITANVPEATSQVFIGEVRAQLTTPGIWVHSQDSSKAKALIDQEVAKLCEQRNLRTDWICADCGEENSPEFAVCWSCQSEYETKVE
ncbi:MAG: hypothetical protein HON04_08100 [Planctomicrobium sp.]|mgnify:CR=1 FL=1|jgi:hypothetical protein|nr:hypothetical protein [Planctomicrobium sp.]